MYGRRSTEETFKTIFMNEVGSILSIQHADAHAHTYKHPHTQIQSNKYIEKYSKVIYALISIYLTALFKILLMKDNIRILRGIYIYIYICIC